MLWKLGQQPKWYRLGEMGMRNAQRAKEDAEGSAEGSASSFPNASWPTPSMHSCMCITEQELVHCHLHTKPSQMSRFFIWIPAFAFSFLDLISIRKISFWSTTFLKKKIYESCLITSLPPYFLKTALPASRTCRKYKEKVLPKWGMFLGNALQSTSLLTRHPA